MPEMNMILQCSRVSLEESMRSSTSAPAGRVAAMAMPSQGWRVEGFARWLERLAHRPGPDPHEKLRRTAFCRRVVGRWRCQLRLVRLAPAAAGPALMRRCAHGLRLQDFDGAGHGSVG